MGQVHESKPQFPGKCCFFDDILYLGQPNIEFKCVSHKDINKYSDWHAVLCQFGLWAPLVTIRADSRKAKIV